MSDLRIYVDGIGLCGPCMPDWAAGVPQLSGEVATVLSPTELPPAQSLPAAERRRVGAPVKLSMAVGMEAVRHARIDPSNLAAVFSSTGGDCDNCHIILETLASDERQLSPTRFHNSVHNAPSGYWGIATGCRAPTTSLCALDATFGAALLEAATQALDMWQPCLMVAYDTAYPDPLYALRPIPYPFGVAMLVRPDRQPGSLACLDITLTEEPLSVCTDPVLEKLRTSVPAARSLPLLGLMACQRSGRVVIDYLEHMDMAIELAMPA